MRKEKTDGGERDTYRKGETSLPESWNLGLCRIGGCVQSKLLSYAIRALPRPCPRLGVLVQVIVRNSELPEGIQRKKR
jgi:hypothetical protein